LLAVAVDEHDSPVVAGQDSELSRVVGRRAQQDLVADIEACAGCQQRVLRDVSLEDEAEVGALFERLHLVGDGVAQGDVFDAGDEVL
jgi:hypothetical protein